MNTTIDLARHRSHGSLVFSGRTRGQLVREKAQLDDLDRAEEQVTVKVPNDTISVNSSFFLGMFADSIRFLGEERFREKYLFEGRDISRTVDSGIQEVMRRFSPLLPE